jgi:ABC-2 type transport system permease protein
MLSRIARHEWRVMSAENTPWLILLLLALAVGYAVANGIHSVAFQQATLQRAAGEEANRYAAVKEQIAEIDAGRTQAPFYDPRTPAAAGRLIAWRYAAMPPLPLASLSIGQSDLVPYYFKVSTASRESVLTTNEIENPHRLLHGRFDLSFVVIYLFPLLIIALGYNVISAEREQGTLALLLSQPVPLRTFIAAKVAVRAGLVVALMILFSLLGLVVSGLDVLSPGTAGRLAIWAAVVAAYGAFWFSAVVLVVSCGRSSATNALALSSVWLLLVVVLPSTLNMVVSSLYPMPSRVDMLAALRVATRDTAGKGTQLLARYYGDHPELVAVSDVEQVRNDVAVTQLAIDEEVERRVRPVVDRYDVQLARQQSVVDRFRLFSPAIVAQDALNDVAGTGAARYRHFVSMVEDYHEGWQALFASMVVSKQKLTPATYDQLPRFTYREEPLRGVLSRVAKAVAVLAAASIAFLFAGFTRLTNYRIA